MGSRQNLISTHLSRAHTSHLTLSCILLRRKMPAHSFFERNTRTEAHWNLDNNRRPSTEGFRWSYSSRRKAIDQTSAPRVAAAIRRPMIIITEDIQDLLTLALVMAEQRSLAGTNAIALKFQRGMCNPEFCTNLHL